jgi:hypothetical protein
MSNPRQDNNIDQSFNFYRDYSQGFLMILTVAIIVMLLAASLVLYQIMHKPLPSFVAVAPDGKEMSLIAHNEPNYLPETLTRWAKKAVVAAYTFDFANYDKQLDLARPFFTAPGWENYINSIRDLIQSITANQLFVNGVVTGAPVISNQGDIGNGYRWVIQLPFLVTTQSAETTVQKKYMVTLTVVKIPTQINPVGIGIDRFVMSAG